MNKFQNVDEEELPQHFQNVVATGLMANKRYRNTFYPNTFMDVRMIVEHAGALEALKRHIEAFKRTAKWKSYMSIYHVREYEIIENALNGEECEDYRAAMQADKIKKKLENDGELIRNII